MDFAFASHVELHRISCRPLDGQEDREDERDWLENRGKINRSSHEFIYYTPVSHDKSFSGKPSLFVPHCREYLKRIFNNHPIFYARNLLSSREMISRSKFQQPPVESSYLVSINISWQGSFECKNSSISDFCIRFDITKW